MSFVKSTSGMTKNKDEEVALDSSAKNMKLYYKPDFRSLGDSYKTIADATDKERESNFKMTINPNLTLTKDLNSKTDKGNHHSRT